MKRLALYLAFGSAVLLLSACGSSPKTASTKTAPVKHEDHEKAIKAKYASIMGVTPHDIENYRLYSFIDAWYGTPYKWAGRSRDGVDCSDFVSILYDQVYGSNYTGTCVDLLNECKIVKEANLQEGDLVFFRINSKHASHVGVYLMNHRFVHASVHAGVVISDLTEAYYKKYFYKAGRLKLSITENTYKG